MLKRSLLFVLMAGLFLLSAPVEAMDDAPESSYADLLEIGTTAPPVSLPDILGVQVNIKQFLGRSPVVLSFWSIYSDSCVNDMLSLQKLEDKYQGDGLAIMAVNEDIRVPRERIRRFVERLEKYRGKVTYPLLFDEESKVFNAYRVSTLPTLILIDSMGRVAGYSRGFDPEGETDLLGSIEALVKETDSTESVSAEKPDERREFITVSGEAALCGFFDNNGWRKSFTGSDSLEQEMELTRDLSRRWVTRQTVTQSIRRLGIKLYSSEPMTGCVNSNGIHLSRDPFDMGDPTSNLIGLMNYSDYFETIEEQEMLIDKIYYTSRKVRVSMDRLVSELESLGYLFEPLRITFTYVNVSRLEQKAFTGSILNQSMYIGRMENPTFTSYSTSQIFEVYTSSQGFADEILGMDFGELQVFVEEVTPTSLELEVWK